MGVVQSVLFLFTFRFVFGGAVQGGPAHYADFFVPGYACGHRGDASRDGCR
jgi:hypothetical protein